jgi:hypothetical protein
LLLIGGGVTLCGMKAIFRSGLFGFLLALGLLAAPTPPPFALHGIANAVTAIPGEPDAERRTHYTPSASTGPFSVGFDLYGDGTDYANWVEVYVNGVKVTQSGNWTMDSPSGTIANLARPITDARITFTAAQTGTVDIVGARRPRRTAQFTESQPITAHSQNQVLTDLWMTLRERWDRIARTMLAPPGETIGPLPAASARANMFLGFDALGNPIMLSAANSSAIVGPGTTTSGDFVLWNSTNGTFVKDGGAPALIANSGSATDLITGTVPAARMPALTGDTITSSGSVVTTTGKVNGVSYPASPSTDQVPVVTAANTANYKTVPACTDTLGNHLNYDQSTHAFSCGTTSSGSIPPACVKMYPSANQTTAAWNVIDAFGSAISTAGTTTQGLQEAINYAVTNGQCLDVIGGGPHVIATQNGTITSGSAIITGIPSTASLLVGDWVTSQSAAGAGIPSFVQILSIDSSSQIHITKNATASSTISIKYTRGAGSNLNNYIAASTGISIPPAEQFSFTARDINLTFSSSVNGPGLTFDSMMIGDFQWLGGQIVYQPATPSGVTSCAVYMHPRTPVGVDGITAITASKIYISNPVSIAGSGTARGVWCFDLDTGGVTNNIFGSQEINATSTTNYGMLVSNEMASTAFTKNIVDISNIHLAVIGGLQLDTVGTHAANIFGNTFRVSGIQPNGTNAAGIDTWGPNNNFTIGGITNEEGTLKYGIVFEASGNANIATVGTISGAGTASILDGGTSNLVLANGGPHKAWPVSTGGTGLASLTNHSVLLGAGSSAVNPLAVPASGTLLQGVAASDPIWSPTPTLGVAGTTVGTLSFANATSGTVKFQPVTGALGSAVLSIPAATDTLVGKATTDTLTNKTFDTAGTGNSLSINGVAATANTGTGSVVRATSPTLVTPVLGVATATSINGATVPSVSDTLVGKATTDTLTNKTLTSPVVSGGTIDNAVIGGTTPAAGTFTTLNGKAGNSSTNIRASGVITTQLTSTGTGADTTKDTLQTYTLPANALDAVGRGIRIKAWGTFAANANTKTVTLEFGAGNTVATSTGLTSSGSNWVMWTEVYKTASNVQTSFGTSIFQNSTPATTVATSTQTDTSAIVLNVTGQNGTASANDIVCKGMVVEFMN